MSINCTLLHLPGIEASKGVPNFQGAAMMSPGFDPGIPRVRIEVLPVSQATLEGRDVV